jgi:RND family efflux transporter MFP subunit
MNARFLLLCAALAVAGCGRSDPASVQTDAPTLPVRTAVVVLEQVPLMLEAPATVHPAERAVIAAKLTGTVTDFRLGLGQAVAAGEVLLTLSAPEAEARLRQAQAQLAEASRAADRERTLVAKGVNAPDAQRDAEDRLRYAQAAAAEAEALLSYATVRAPFAGVMTVKHVLTGDLATPGLPLLALESTARLRAEGAVPEAAAGSLHLGGSIAVVLDDAGVPVPGTIEELSPAADAVSRSIQLKAALPPGSARSGQFARLRVAVGEAPALFVPEAAVTRFGQMERVYVVIQGRAVLRLVKTGRSANGRSEILSGLNVGETIVVAPPPALRDGQPVTVSP